MGEHTAAACSRRAVHPVLRARGQRISRAAHWRNTGSRRGGSRSPGRVLAGSLRTARKQRRQPMRQLGLEPADGLTAAGEAALPGCLQRQPQRSTQVSTPPDCPHSLARSASVPGSPSPLAPAQASTTAGSIAAANSLVMDMLAVVACAVLRLADDLGRLQCVVALLSVLRSRPM